MPPGESPENLRIIIKILTKIKEKPFKFNFNIDITYIYIPVREKMHYI
jgi:hypothetical protein